MLHELNVIKRKKYIYNIGDIIIISVLLFFIIIIYYPVHSSSHLVSRSRNGFLDDGIFVTSPSNCALLRQ